MPIMRKIFSVDLCFFFYTYHMYHLATLFIWCILGMGFLWNALVSGQIAPSQIAPTKSQAIPCISHSIDV